MRLIWPTDNSNYRDGNQYAYLIHLRYSYIYRVTIFVWKENAWFDNVHKTFQYTTDQYNPTLSGELHAALWRFQKLRFVLCIVLKLFIEHSTTNDQYVDKVLLDHTDQSYSFKSHNCMLDNQRFYLNCNEFMYPIYLVTFCIFQPLQSWLCLGISPSCCDRPNWQLAI